MKLARLVLLLSICAALLLPVASAQAQTVKKVSDGQVSKTAPNWANFIANDKGFFRREGVEPETFYVGNVANTVQQLVAGLFDVASSTFDTAIRAIANGGNAVLVGGMVTKYPYSIMASTRRCDRRRHERQARHPAVRQGPAHHRLEPLADRAGHAAATTSSRSMPAPRPTGLRRSSGRQRAGGAADPAVRFPRRRRAATASSSTSAPTARNTGSSPILARPQWLRDNPETARGLSAGAVRRRRLALRARPIARKRSPFSRETPTSTPEIAKADLRLLHRAS